MSDTRKELGQHWLRDLASLQSIAEAADVKQGDLVLEIGPGQGTLTDELLGLNAKVVALEYDHTLFQKLVAKYQAFPNHISIQEGDIRSYDLGRLPENYKIVANIPYYLTANLLRKLVEDENRPSIASLLVQKEVAQRVAAKPGDLSLIAVLVQLFYEVSTGAEVPAYLFEPPPKVDSQVLILTKRPEPLVSESDGAKLLRLLKAGFAQKRKKLKTSLSVGLEVGKGDSEAWLKAIGVSPAARPQELTIDQWLGLVHEVYPEN